MKRLVFGIGTGRCGTYSLAKLLDAQAGVKCLHEYNFCSWEYREEDCLRNLDYLLSQPEDVVGDVGFYYLNYVEHIIKLHPNSKFVALWRPKEEVVRSWNVHSGGMNHWTDSGSDFFRGWKESNNSKYFPKYDLPKLDAIAQYHDDYYSEVKILIAEYPSHIRMWHMDSVLNEREGRKELFSFLGIEGNIGGEYKYNAQGTKFIEHEPMPYKLGACEFCKTEDSAEWYIINKRNDMYSYSCNECKVNKKLGAYNKEDV